MEIGTSVYFANTDEDRVEKGIVKEIRQLGDFVLWWVSIEGRESILLPPDHFQETNKLAQQTLKNFRLKTREELERNERWKDWLQEISNPENDALIQEQYESFAEEYWESGILLDEMRKIIYKKTGIQIY